MTKKKQTSGFKIPENYFEGFEIAMFEKLQEEDLPKSSGFNVPEGYFYAVDEKILETAPHKWQLFKTAQNHEALQHRIKIVYSIAGIAAAIAVILTIISLKGNNAVSFDDLKTENIASYIEDSASDITAYDLSSYLQGEDLTTFDVPSQNLNEDNLSDYLFNNLDDSTLLLE
jgi:hypothetical protein